MMDPNSILNFSQNLVGVEFVDIITGRLCIIRKTPAGGFYVHHREQGTWTPWRAPTHDDIRRLHDIEKGVAK